MHGQLLTVLVPEARHPINPTLSDLRKRSVGFLSPSSCMSSTHYKCYILSNLQKLLSRESKKSKICSPGRTMIIAP